MFSSRLPSELAPNALSRAVERARSSGASILDLTETNPTAVQLSYPEGLLDALADSRALRYEPEPLGIAQAREAVAATYSARGIQVDPGRVVLTTSTSEAYAILFKLLADAGDRVLVPQPSYPLFDLLARLEAVEAAPYRLVGAAGWAVDRTGFEQALDARTRAVLVVSPNNPTGSLIGRSDREFLVEAARARDLAIVSDEVFADYLLSPAGDRTSFASEARVLTFTLGGLSKSAGLPQVKLAWFVASGPDAAVRAALDRVAVIADTYLSVSTSVQFAAPQLITAGAGIRRGIGARVRRNLERLRTEAAAQPSLTLVEPEGGWSAVLRVPAIGREEDIVLRLLQEAGVLVHPGYFFDFADEAFLVMSLLPAPEVFDEGVSRIGRFIGGLAS